ncbi:MAG: peptide chain release factor N(5)-glutamine methyltransferase [Desulfamplus sp.]|nr:peptide chain release factor N(5)-glutamine methyltransferase [Desulfamplus sp.]
MQTENNLSDRWTILKIISWTTNYFKEFDIDSPRLTAEILLCHALNIRRIDLYLQFDRPLNSDELAQYKSLIRRRLKKEPVAYITGSKGFWDSQFIVTPDVLIPRPDTELIVEVALNLIKQKKNERQNKVEQYSKIEQNIIECNEKIEKHNKSLDQHINILELGTGSGAISISLAKENQNSSDIIFFATDISLKAAIIAKKNSLNAIMKPSQNLFFLIGSWFSPIKPEAKFDIIISNPPYIPTNDIKTLQEEVRDYEPLLALDGGSDGISSLKEIMRSAHHYLTQDGILLMEMGFDQKEKIELEALKICKYEPPIFIKDYAGHNRVVSLKKI